jgi:hypothetical protein
MIPLLSEILSSIHDEEEMGMVDLDDWKLSEVDHLIEMGFEPNGQYKLVLPNPRMMAFKKKKVLHQLPKNIKAVGEGYVLIDDDKKKTHIFPTFASMVEFFDNYEQDLRN